jgi:hypothetical protein
MGFILTVLLSLIFGIAAAVVMVLAGFLVTGFVFHLGDLGMGLTEIGAIVVGIAVFVLSLRKMW